MTYMWIFNTGYKNTKLNFRT